MRTDPSEQLLSKTFFDLDDYQHAALFSNIAHVWEALGKIEKYLREASLKAIEVDIPEGTTVHLPELISIGEGTQIEPGAYISGPCIIGKNCVIRHGAYIRGHVITGDGCVIGHATEVKNSIFLNHALAAHFAYVGDSILGNYVNLGAGTKCANLRLDGKEVVVRVGGQKLKTGRRKFGAIFWRSRADWLQCRI